MLLFLGSTLIIFAILLISISTFVSFAPVFGDAGTKEYKKELSKSTNYKDGKFWNLVSMTMKLQKTDNDNNPMKEYFFGKNKKQRAPQIAIQNIRFDKIAFAKEENAYSWFGHSTILIRTEGKTIITDPVFEKASPVRFFGPAEFKMTNKLTAKDLPDNIDFVLITHDHYDHLDYRTIKKIHKNVKYFIVPLGLKYHLLRWGVPEEKITELDWYNSKENDGINITLTPTKHFSGRGITNRMSTLWGGFIIKSKSKNIYVSGDGGYSNEFKKIGEEYGPFDIAFMENGAYNKAWKDVHMFPEESVKAATEVKAKVVLPIHWGKYDLSIHPWTEPIERFSVDANKNNLSFITPQIGEIFTENSTEFSNNWWKN